MAGLAGSGLCRIGAAVWPVLMLGALAGPGQACRLALVLGLDVSASVDTAEYRLQMRGTAAALLSAPVRRVILAGEPVALAAFMWSGARERWLISDWVLMDGAATLEAFAGQIAAVARPPFHGRTATGEAMAAGVSLLSRAPGCGRLVLDLATDGEANDGVAPLDVVAGAVTINALSIGGDMPLDHGDAGEPLRPLSRWLQRHVIRGPGAFVELAVDYRDVEQAMQRKLLRELAEFMMGRSGAGQGAIR